MADNLHEVVIHCKGLIFDQQGRLLLVQQAETFGTYWNAPGGRMEAADTLESCLVREIQEETGLIVEDARLAYSHTFASPGVSDIYFGYHVTRYSGEVGVSTSLTEKEQVEITDMRFVAQEEDLSHPLFPLNLWDVAGPYSRGEVRSAEYLGTETRESY